MTAGDAVAIIIVLAITAYACTGIPDFGAGFWDLTAGGRRGGQGARALIDEAITPVWEANHVWLIYILVVSWTAFGAAFGDVMTTLFVPFILAALGIVLRGANFALRKDAARAGGRHIAAWLFGIGAIITPFFFGTAVGAIMSGRVPSNGHGNPASSWWNATSITVGVLVVAVSAFLSAAYLVAESDRRGMAELHDYFRDRAAIAGVVGLLAGIAAAFALHSDSLRMFHRFVHRSIPLLAVGVVALAVTFVLALRGRTRRIRIPAVIGVAALVWAWGVAQYPYLLPFSMTISSGAGASQSLHWMLIWFLVALVTVVPLLVVLFVLDQRGELGEDPTMSRPEPTPKPHPGSIGQ
jgi:cytochrome d ubiquinol oxidase subunit II